MEYRPTHFKLYELVPPELYNTLHHDLLWSMFDEELLRGLDWLKDLFPEGFIIVNNWKNSFNGYTQSGIRTKGSKYYSEGSAHSAGKAVDLKFSAYTPEEVRDKLRDVKFSPFIRRVELGTETWVHVDVVVKEGHEKSIYFFWP